MRSKRSSHNSTAFPVNGVSITLPSSTGATTSHSRALSRTRWHIVVIVQRPVVLLAASRYLIHTTTSIIALHLAPTLTPATPSLLLVCPMTIYLLFQMMEMTTRTGMMVTRRIWRIQTRKGRSVQHRLGRVITGSSSAGSSSIVVVMNIFHTHFEWLLVLHRMNALSQISVPSWFNMKGTTEQHDCTIWKVTFSTSLSCSQISMNSTWSHWIPLHILQTVMGKKSEN
jgi:hypothetical protein